MRCSFLLFTATAVIVSAKRLCLYDVPHSRQQRNALKQPTIEELLHELVSSDSRNFHEESEPVLRDRGNWLIKVFEIGMAENKRSLLKKQEMLRFFRENYRDFSPRTNIVEFANNIVPQLENYARKIKEFGYSPIEALRATYTMAFNREYLENEREGQLEMIREAIRHAVLPPTTTTTTTTTTPSPPTRLYFPQNIEIMEMIGDQEDKEKEEDENGFSIEAGEIEIENGPANMIITPKPQQTRTSPVVRQAPPMPQLPQCLDLERCNGQGECQSRIEGLYMTAEEECACFEGFTGPTCSELAVPEAVSQRIPEEPQSSPLSSSPGRSFTAILLIFLGVLL